MGYISSDTSIYHGRAKKEHRCINCGTLEEENAQLRWYLNDIRRMIERVPDNTIPRSARLKQWGKQTAVELFTRTAPRIMVLWGGAGLIAYIVTVVMK